MRKFLRLIVCLTLTFICLTFGCGGGNSNTYPVVVFSDVHFNPFYDPTLFWSLNDSDASEWNRIFQGSGISSPSTWGDDTNYPLLLLALQSIKQNQGTSPVIIFTGDILGHNLATTFFNLYGSSDVAALEAFLDKTVSFFTSLVKSYVGDLPVMFVLGNADSYTGLGPDSTFLANTAATYYSDWIGSTADQQTFLSTYEADGYYSAEPLNGLKLIALNTFSLSTLAVGDVDAKVQAQLTWLEQTLDAARNAGQKVWILMHVPPGAYIGATAENLDVNGHLSTASMMLKPDYQTSLLQTLSSYSDVITLMLAGHTHMDEFRNIYGSPLSSTGSLEITPGITPYFNNNPGYKIYTFRNDFAPYNFTTYNYNLATLPAQFNDYYVFSESYFNSFVHGLLNESLVTLYPMLSTDDAAQQLYRTYYYAGNNSLNQITNTNWKVFYCGIIKMTEQKLLDCVNSF